MPTPAFSGADTGIIAHIDDEQPKSGSHARIKSTNLGGGREREDGIANLGAI